jgi:hypothetical protein
MIGAESIRALARMINTSGNNQLKTLSMPEDFFHRGPAGYPLSYSASIDVFESTMIKDFTRTHNLRDFSFLFAVYVALLAHISGESTLTVYALDGESRLFDCSFLDLENISILDLAKRCEVQLEGLNKPAIGEKYFTFQKAEHTLVPLIYMKKKKRHYHPILEQSGLSLGIQEKSDSINVTIDYNWRILDRKKVKQFLDDYFTLLAYTLNSLFPEREKELFSSLR